MTPNTPHDPLVNDPRYALVEFIRHHVQPPGTRYITRDDVLELVCWVPTADTTVNLSLRFQAPDGQILPRFETRTVTANGATPTAFVLQNAEGFLQSASVETPGAPRGQAYIALRIRRGGGSGDNTQGEYLLLGYPGSSGGLSFPGAEGESPITWTGKIRSIPQANPAAGANWSVTVPAGTEWVLQFLYGQLLTGADAGPRITFVQFKDPAGAIIAQMGSGNGIDTATLLTLTYAMGLAASSELAASLQIYVALPLDFRLQAGSTVEVITDGIFPADQWSQIVVTVEEHVAG